MTKRQIGETSRLVTGVLLAITVLLISGAGCTVEVRCVIHNGDEKVDCLYDGQLIGQLIDADILHSLHSYNKIWMGG